MSTKSGDAETGTGTHAKARLSTLALGALGVVFGDIGTSPLYALKESFVKKSLLQSADKRLQLPA